MTTKNKRTFGPHGIVISDAEARLIDAKNLARTEADKARERQARLERACDVAEGIRMLTFTSEVVRDAIIEDLVQEVLGE